MKKSQQQTSLITSEFKSFSIKDIKIKEGEIKFDAPIIIDYLIHHDEEKISYIYDFGLSKEFTYYSDKTFSEKVITEYFKEEIKSDLARTFFLPQESDDYSLLNWALYGNLKNRAIVKHTF